MVAELFPLVELLCLYYLIRKEKKRKKKKKKKKKKATTMTRKHMSSGEELQGVAVLTRPLVCGEII